MLVTNVYNVADTYFVSQLGTSASGAVGIIFGLMSIIQAFGFMLGWLIFDEIYLGLLYGIIFAPVFGGLEVVVNNKRGKKNDK